MQREHRDAIQSNYTSLVERTDLDSVITGLFERNVFSAVMMERYRDTSVSERDRKRKLYMDITRRGPHAFDNLLEVLSEVGNWDLVRMLDPTSGYQPIQTHNSMNSNREIIPRVDEKYLSISDQKKIVNEMQKMRLTTGNSGKPAQEPQAPRAASPPPPELSDCKTEYVPKLQVIKSTKSFEEDKDIESYPMLENRRGLLLIFSYVNFDYGLEPMRNGVDVDNANLKYLFSEMGFKVMLSQDYTRDETLASLLSLNEMVEDADCVFVVVSSHGHQTDGSDTSIRCRDNRFISTYEIIEHFSNNNLPEFVGLPKVFVFQTCRGASEDYAWLKSKSVAPPHMLMPPGDVSADCSADPPADTQPPAAHRPPSPQVSPDGRPVTEKGPAYSDILIAQSTIPRYVSYRDKTYGSWYIQVLCQVFAERAHDCDVEKLFTLVDKGLQARFQKQVSSIDKWGFNKRLRLHPGRRKTAQSHY